MRLLINATMSLLIGYLMGAVVAHRITQSLEVLVIILLMPVFLVHLFSDHLEGSSARTG